MKIVKKRTVSNIENKVIKNKKFDIIKDVQQIYYEHEKLY